MKLSESVKTADLRVRDPDFSAVVYLVNVTFSSISLGLHLLI